jgi:hypothetical protein
MKVILYIAALSLSACALQPIALYDTPAEEDTRPHIGNLYALEIYQDGMASDMWFTEKTECIQVAVNEELKAAGNSSMEIQWDKPNGGCDWIGMGFGWDNWSGKDLSQTFDAMGIHMKVRAKEGQATRWVWPDEILKLDLVAADVDLASELADRLPRGKRFVV